MHTHTKSAEWFLAAMNVDETILKRRTGAFESLQKLKKESEALVYRIYDSYIDYLAGKKIGGFKITAESGTNEIQQIVHDFYQKHFLIFVSNEIKNENLKVEKVKFNGSTIVKVQQYLDGIMMVDKKWTIIFDKNGYLCCVTSKPADPKTITISRVPQIDQKKALENIIVADIPVFNGRTIQPEDRFDFKLGFLGNKNQLIWFVEYRNSKKINLFRNYIVDAHKGSVTCINDMCSHGLKTIPVQHYSHPDGIKDSTHSFATSDINVDTFELEIGSVKADVYTMQRLGSGRARIWNAKPVGSDPTPLFSRSISFLEDYFTKGPLDTDDHVFNEQQTYYWAQVLKTKVDEWGREINDYGHYPVDDGRDVNVEIVVNGSAEMEIYWDSNSDTGPVTNPDGVCMHGYCNTMAERSWFLDYPGTGSTVPAVFFFNSMGNQNSPQFFGKEYSGSYSIIAHEIGHFISWQYGGWSGPLGELGGSLNEGHSMVIAALLGKQNWSSLDYSKSDYVTTGGGDISGSQWSYHPIGSAALKYSSMDAINSNRYYIAMPFVQAMWQLMNNKDVNGDKIWKTPEAAISNTADLFMYSLYHFTYDNEMTWDKLCYGLMHYMYDRITDRKEKEPLEGYDSWCAVYKVFADYDLFSKCINSP